MNKKGKMKMKWKCSGPEKHRLRFRCGLVAVSDNVECEARMKSFWWVGWFSVRAGENNCPFFICLLTTHFFLFALFEMKDGDGFVVGVRWLGGTCLITVISFPRSCWQYFASSADIVGGVLVWCENSYEMKKIKE
jgi:hypothetical protein